MLDAIANRNKFKKKKKLCKSATNGWIIYANLIVCSESESCDIGFRHMALVRCWCPQGHTVVIMQSHEQAKTYVFLFHACTSACAPNMHQVHAHLICIALTFLRDIHQFIIGVKIDRSTVSLIWCSIHIAFQNYIVKEFLSSFCIFFPHFHFMDLFACGTVISFAIHLRARTRIHIFFFSDHPKYWKSTISK